MKFVILLVFNTTLISVNIYSQTNLHISDNIISTKAVRYDTSQSLAITSPVPPGTMIQQGSVLNMDEGINKSSAKKGQQKNMR